MTDVISRDILEWARDLAEIRDLIARDLDGERAISTSSALARAQGCVVTLLRPLLQETVA